jgi:hypothetical protein
MNDILPDPPRPCKRCGLRPAAAWWTNYCRDCYNIVHTEPPPLPPELTNTEPTPKGTP